MRAALTVGWAMVSMLALPVVPAAQAASFDCARASTEVEKAICANPALSRSDDVLATAYATALGGLSDEGRAALQAGQREWLGFAALACTEDARPFTAPLTDEQQECLDTIYRERIGVLAQSRMEGEWRVYPKTSYSLVDDPDPDAYQGVATKQISSPRIDEESEVARSFNALMEGMDAAARPDPQAEDYLTSDTAYAIRVASVGSRRISVMIDNYWMGHGAAHGNYAVTYAHFLTGEGRMLEAGDLFAGAGWQEALGKLATEALEERLKDAFWEDSRADVPKIAADPARWNLTEDGLEITFQPYEVAPYAAGAPAVTIGWDELGDHLAPDYGDLLY